MAQIKSALELALERTVALKGDPKRAQAHEYKQEGKRLLSKLQQNRALNIQRELQNYTKEQQIWVREGFYSVLISYLSLPSSEEQLDKLKLLRTGLTAILKHDTAVRFTLDQIDELATRYLDDRKQLIEGLRAQFAQRLQQRAQGLSRQLGMAVQVDPASDPEFSEALRRNLNVLQMRYNQVIDQVRTDLDSLFNGT